MPQDFAGWGINTVTLPRERQHAGHGAQAPVEKSANEWDAVAVVDAGVPVGE